MLKLNPAFEARQIAPPFCLSGMIYIWFIRSFGCPLMIFDKFDLQLYTRLCFADV
jgi:hypothetical protein